MSIHPNTSGANVERTSEEKWVKSHCQMCFNACPIEVHVKGAKAIKIKGDPDDPNTRGRLCARGLSGLTKLYDPDRLKAPLIRTNPEKGEGIDPKWKEASWEEALDLVAKKLKKIRLDNPNKLICSLWPWEKYIQTFGYSFNFGFSTFQGNDKIMRINNKIASLPHILGV
jgi:anaerobic selenocysteine-containing dehydrogenase